MLAILVDSVIGPWEKKEVGKYPGSQIDLE